MMSTRAEIFWDRHAPKYVAKPIADQPSYEAKLNHVRSLLLPADKVLEIGCGSGNTALQLASTCAHVTASDLSSRMIEGARSRLRNTNTRNVRFVHADANRILADGPFDTILAFSLLHLVPDVLGTLGAIHAQLKPGGLFISKTVCIAERNFGIRSMVRFMSAAPFTPDVHILSQSALRYMIQQAGFEVIETRYFGDQCMDPFVVARRHA